MLTIHNTEAIRRIETAIGYTFRDKRLLVQVLTRKTYLKIDPEAPDNEVLEFYGDTLMNYHVTNYFMSKYAHMLEDGLFFMRTVEQFTDLRSHYVCNRYLTERVKALGLARYLRAQNRDAELRRDGEKAYADIFESLVGAIYLDSYQNESLIRSFILRQLGIEPKRAPADIEAFDFDTLRDLPEDIPYNEPDEDLLPVEAAPEEIAAPTVVVDAPEEVPAEITPEDAPIAVTVSEMIAEPAVEESPVPAETPASPVTNRDKLSMLCEELGFASPTYSETPPNAPNARPVAACTLKYKDTRGKQVKISLNDSGKTLAEATEKAAAKMLGKVEKIAAEIKRTDTVEKPEKPSKSNTPRRHAAADTPATDAQTPVAIAPPTEEAPAPEASPEVIPAEAIPVEAIPAEAIPAEATPAEAILADPSIEEAPANGIVPEAATEAPVEELHTEVKPSQKPSSTKKKSSKKKPVTVAVPPDVSVAEPIAAEAPETEESPAPKAFSKKKSTSKKKTSPAEEQPVAVASEDAKEANPITEVKPVKKTSSKKKSTTPKETSPAEEQPAAVVTEDVKADVSQAEDKPVKKSSSRKRSTPKKEAAAPASTSDDQ